MNVTRNSINKSSRFSSVFAVLIRFVLVGAISVTSVFAQSLSDATRPDGTYGPDIIGLQLGMTHDEVRAVLKQAAVPYRMQDGVAQINAPTLGRNNFFDKFIVEINAEGHDANKNYERVKIVFSGPPNDARVIEITRSVQYNPSNLETVPFGEQYKSAVKKKYGDPDFNSDTNISSLNVWGKPQCLHNTGFNWGNHRGELGNRNPSECGPQLAISISDRAVDDRVITVQAYLVDIPFG
ncbi:MAG: hypothetical protein GY771_02070, partial [bacterium]|nr:hypothetical protein [bacterium]